MHDPDWRALAAGGALVLALGGLAGCNKGAEPDAVPSSLVTESTDAGVATDETNTGAPTGAVASLSAYVGKYPLDKVGDYAFFQHPVVQEGLSRAVTDPKVLAAIAAIKGPVGPVMRKDNDIAASQCQQHDCGAHNYAIHVDATTNTVSSVCYYDEQTGPIATWYKPDGSKVSEGDGCSVG
ncbi:MAG: hypothetical protein J7530_12720 [Novosphingobium sp.]|nr:hypothetical protein [Novosphingobium sp.]